MDGRTEVQQPTARDTGRGTRDRILDLLPVEDIRIDPAGIPTAVLAGGEGPPLVLLHGQGEFAGVWMRVIPDLARSYRVIVPDLPGHGASGLGANRLTRPRVMRWLGDLIASTCSGPPVIAGHLLGGAIAARFAAARPSGVAGLVLVDSFGLAWSRPSLRFALPMFRFLLRPNERTQERLFQQCMLDLDGLRVEMQGTMQLLEAYALERAREDIIRQWREA